MNIQFSHRTTYTYTTAVTLGPHVIRLAPRNSLSLQLVHHELEVLPEPACSSWCLDAQGNTVLRCWFSEPTDRLIVRSEGEVNTLRTNPFDYLLDDEALELPMRWTARMGPTLLPYLSMDASEETATVRALARRWGEEAEQQPLAYLERVNQGLFEMIRVGHRAEGVARKPSDTLERRRGACRDVAVLFIELCRQMGLPARFVSGYVEGMDIRGDHHLHAWPEVYIPGGGWRGYDPTQGLAVSNRHIPLAAGEPASTTLPIEGAYFAPDANSLMTSELAVVARGVESAPSGV